MPTSDGTVLLTPAEVAQLANDPNPEMRGYVMLGRNSELRPRESAIMTLAGRWGDAGWPPKRPSKLGSTFDERDLADEVETLGQGQRGYELLVADTRHLASTLEFKELAEMLELFLARGCVLRKAHLEDMHRVVVRDTKLEHKTLKTKARTSTELGEFSAIAAAYSIDRDGDQIVRVRSGTRSSVGRPAANGSRCTGTTAPCRKTLSVDRPGLDEGDRRRAVRTRQARHRQVGQRPRRLGAGQEQCRVALVRLPRYR
jgi:hypothetical protein